MKLMQQSGRWRPHAGFNSLQAAIASANCAGAKNLDLSVIMGKIVN
jgi:hypothetical protein